MIVFTLYVYTFKLNITQPMKKNNLILMGIAALGLSLASCGGETKNETVAETEGVAKVLAVDTDQSTLAWTGTMLGLYSHNGTINLSSGSLEMTGEQVSGGSFVIDMTSIIPLDSGYGKDPGSTSADLVGHLSSGDFFDVANNPTATFQILSVEGNKASGKMKLRGTEGEETIENISISGTEGNYTITGDITFDRKKYGAMFDMPVADKVLSNDIKLNISLKTKA
jgi:polyisoprenoid-binding protein YceI